MKESLQTPKSPKMSPKMANMPTSPTSVDTLMSRIGASSTSIVRSDKLTRRASSNSLRDKRKSMSSLAESTGNLSTLSEKVNIPIPLKSTGKRASFNGKANKPNSDEAVTFPMFDEIRRMKGDLEVNIDPVKNTDKGGGKNSPLPSLPKISGPIGSLERRNSNSNLSAVKSNNLTVKSSSTEKDGKLKWNSGTKRTYKKEAQNGLDSKNLMIQTSSDSPTSHRMSASPTSVSTISPLNNFDSPISVTGIPKISPLSPLHAPNTRTEKNVDKTVLVANGDKSVLVADVNKTVLVGDAAVKCMLEVNSEDSLQMNVKNRKSGLIIKQDHPHDPFSGCKNPSMNVYTDLELFDPLSITESISLSPKSIDPKLSISLSPSNDTVLTDRTVMSDHTVMTSRGENSLINPPKDLLRRRRSLDEIPAKDLDGKSQKRPMRPASHIQSRENSFSLALPPKLVRRLSDVSDASGENLRSRYGSFTIPARRNSSILLRDGAIGCNLTDDMLTSMAEERKNKEKDIQSSRTKQLEDQQESFSMRLCRHENKIIQKAKMKKSKLLSVIMKTIKMQNYIINSLPSVKEQLREHEAEARSKWLILRLFYKYIKRKRNIYHTKLLEDSALNRLAFVVHTRIWKKNLRVRIAKDFLNACALCTTYKGFSSMYVRRFVKNVRLVQRFVRSFLACKTIRVMALLKAWDTVEWNLIRNMIKTLDKTFDQKKDEDTLDHWGGNTRFGGAGERRGSGPQHGGMVREGSMREGMNYDQRIAKLDAIRIAKTQALEMKIEFTMKKHGLKKASHYQLPLDVKKSNIKGMIEEARKKHVRLHIDAVKSDREATQKKMMTFSLEDASDLLLGDGSAVIEMVERKMNPNMKVEYKPPDRKTFFVFRLFNKKNLMERITKVHEEMNTFRNFK
mmetsp:Transcript_6148/g.6312  ORF Transcript_6148/g.6312 Transcript_6148/m.6312 type:complete len:904 (+) Transcript_6148:319-3030(+)|eukprot:CAMPEP_0119038864 /NCGR_PEP_ID=MMETSP1177-20130426/8027_1 /TAXON_ID=2985 /ORGANISM="Ochromonas sp, Strain CCMP1899" /LENGTH=903 /DNA_ID=CAMNT_0007001977 /DNA_START=306 /DNA_END=3017 /DNA_ORIENTATION=-